MTHLALISAAFCLISHCSFWSWQLILYTSLFHYGRPFVTTLTRTNLPKVLMRLPAKNKLHTTWFTRIDYYYFQAVHTTWSNGRNHSKHFQKVLTIRSAKIQHFYYLMSIKKNLLKGALYLSLPNA